MTENRRTLRRRGFCALAGGAAVSFVLSTGCSRRDWAYASMAGRLTARPHACRKSYISGRTTLGLDSARDAILQTRGAGVSIKPGVERGFASGTPGSSVIKIVRAREAGDRGVDRLTSTSLDVG